MSRGIIWAAQQSIAATDIVSTVALGTISEAPARCIIIDNLTEGDLQIYVNGTANANKAFVVAARSGRIIDISSNKLASPPDDGPVQPLLSQFYVSAITGPGTTGSVYLSYFYERGE